MSSWKMVHLQLNLNTDLLQKSWHCARGIMKQVILIGLYIRQLVVDLELDNRMPLLNELPLPLLLVE